MPRSGDRIKCDNTNTITQQQATQLISYLDQAVGWEALPLSRIRWQVGSSALGAAPAHGSRRDASGSRGPPCEHARVARAVAVRCSGVESRDPNNTTARMGAAPLAGICIASARGQWAGKYTSCLRRGGVQGRGCRAIIRGPVVPGRYMRPATTEFDPWSGHRARAVGLVCGGAQAGRRARAIPCADAPRGAGARQPARSRRRLRSRATRAATRGPRACAIRRSPVRRPRTWCPEEPAVR